MVQSVDMNVLQYAVSKDYQVLLLTSSVPPETLLDNGIGYVGVSKTAVTDEYIQSCIAYGIKVILFTVNHRYERDIFLAKGGSGFFTDEPFYLSEAVDQLSKDPFNNQVFYHGMVKSLTNRGDFTGGNRWGYIYY
ncbi:hypothetical protein [Ornithinibacillus bavariensis]|uniref:hypothetical protein n=1 Tax=Ornithinibacillus bavariensis TaxID=545502 RepID=UPI001BB38DB2|nr:hypothetical protein [Ornithinibacillus bavariensis]